MRALFLGQNGFFKPRFPPPFLSMFTGEAATSFYDTTPLRNTLERLVDFDRLNSGEVRVSVGAVNVRSGNLVYFDTAERRLRPEHFMASGALPPGFPAIEIDGGYYWDGGMVSNTPLSRILSDEPRRDTLTFQVDLWSAKGRLPSGLQDVASRQEDIQYSSRTRAITSHMLQMEKMRQALQHLMTKLPAEARNGKDIAAIADLARHSAHTIIHLKRLGSVDILVNNAGIQFTAPVEDFPAEKWDAILAVNLSAAFHAISAVVPRMKKQG